MDATCGTGFQPVSSPARYRCHNCGTGFQPVSSPARCRCHRPLWVWACLVILIGGCTWDVFRPPAARHEQPAAAEEPPQVVDNEPTPAEPPGDEVSQAVANYIQRMELAHQRADRTEIQQPSPDDTIRQAADEEPQPTSRPANTPSIAPPPKEAAPPAEVPPQPQVVEPPVLVGADVRSAPGTETAIGEPRAVGINAPASARGAPATLQDFVAQMLPPEDGSFREQLDQRILYLLAGEYEQARQPLTMVTAEQQELAARFVDAFIAIREGHMGDLAGAAKAAAAQLTELQESLRRLSDLNMPVLTICSAVRGYGQYEVVEPARFLAGGAEFVLYCEVRDFTSELRDNYYYTTFDMTTAILNRTGDTVFEIKDPDITDRCRNRRQDCFIPRLIRLPASLSPGQYVAKVTVVDKLGQKVAENRATFQLVARP